jgi:hypothetical protein
MSSAAGEARYFNESAQSWFEVLSEHQFRESAADRGEVAG